MKLKKATQAIATKRNDKNEQIVEAAYQLFLEQGFENVSIQEIVTRAGIAKGTFYLYFHDKDQLRDYIITQKSNEIFQRALQALHQTDVHRFDDQVIFVVDYVLDILAQNKEVLKLIAKNLSFGFFNRRLGEYVTDNDADICRTLLYAADKNGVKLRNPQVLLYMIIELASSTCFSCILDAEPLEIASFKPYLFDAIRQLIRSQTLEEYPPAMPHRGSRTV